VNNVVLTYITALIGFYGPGWRSRYRDSLRAGRYRLFPGVKRPGRDIDHPSPSSAEVEERVRLYL